jgi:arsenate reductase (glutaredoxin)
MKIYHNPRCGKSRETLRLLRDHNIEPHVILYLNQPPSESELKSLIQALNMKPFDLIRKKEKVYLESFKGKELTDQECIDAMLQYPILIERPIVVSGDKAVVGRPPSNVLTLM